jgi:hypothetical protein
MQVKIALAKGSTVLFAGLYWTGKSVQQIPLLHQDNLEQNSNTNSTVGDTQSITANYSLTIIAAGSKRGSLADL